MLRKLMILFLLPLLLAACGQKELEETISYSTSSGPLVVGENLTDEEKELRMIQGVIRDYNEDRIADREEYFQIDIPNLPIGITSLPEIDSLDDLKTVSFDQENTNAVYCGEYIISDTVTARFTIYHPTTDSFWLNGDLSFHTDPDQVSESFSAYRDVLESLLSQENDILNWLYGINVDLGKELEPGYFEVIRMGPYSPETIDEIKEIAESVFTVSFLKENYYPAAFNGSSPVYKMIDGKLSCILTDLFVNLETEFATDRIIQTEENNDEVIINLLTKIDGYLDSEIHEIILKHTENGYRLPVSY